MPVSIAAAVEGPCVVAIRSFEYLVRALLVAEGPNTDRGASLGRGIYAPRGGQSGGGIPRGRGGGFVGGRGGGFVGGRGGGVGGFGGGGGA